MAADRRDRLISAGVLLTVVLVVAQAVTQIIDYGLYNDRIAALNSNLHTSVFGIASLIAQAAAVFAALRRSERQPHRVGWVSVAGLVAFLLAVRIFLAYDTVLLVVPTAILFVLCWRLSMGEASRARVLMQGALCLLLFSFLVHAVGGKAVTTLGYDATSWAWQVKGILKHTTELAGWTILSLGVAAAGVSARTLTPARAHARAAAHPDASAAPQ